MLTAGEQATMDIGMKITQKIKTRIAIGPNSSTSGHFPKESLPYHRDTCAPMFIAVLFSITRKLNQHRCPSADEWIIHKGILLSSKEKMKFARKHMSPENIILSTFPRLKNSDNTGSPSYVDPAGV